ELLDEREARSAVAFWFGKGMARAKVSAHLREEASLRDGVRTRALALVEPYEECRVRAEAEQVIRSLFSKPMLQSEVLERLQADTVLGERVRRAAVVLAEQFVDHAPALNRASRAVVRRPGGETAAYALALRQATRACELLPHEGAYHTTL